MRKNNFQLGRWALLFWINFFLVTTAFGQEEKRFSKTAVLEDLDYLYTSLIATHYAPFAYTTEDQFARKYLELKALVKEDISSSNKTSNSSADSLSFLQTTNIFQQLTASLKNGHTEIDFPVGAYTAHLYKGGTLFPLELALEDDKVLVRKNWSEDSGIQVGDQILRIDGKAVEDVLSGIYAQISAERGYFRKAKLEMFGFPRWYWQVYGEKASFDVEYVQQGKTYRATLASILGIEEFEMKREEVIKYEPQLKFFDEVAYIRPGEFGGSLETFQRFVDSSFVEIQTRQSQRLIVDLRNNPGGGDAFSNYLLSYLADKPFYWNGEFHLKSSAILKEDVRKNRDSTEAYWKEILSHKDGETYRYEFEAYAPQEEEKRFKGEVYALINRQSHSQSTVAATQLQDYGWATLVGEETGEYASLYASQFQYDLPKTGIPVKLSKGYIVRVNGSKKEEGVVPDIYIRDHLLDEKDEILETLLEKLD